MVSSIYFSWLGFNPPNPLNPLARSNLTRTPCTSRRPHDIGAQCRIHSLSSCAETVDWRLPWLVSAGGVQWVSHPALWGGFCWLEGVGGGLNKDRWGRAS